MKEPAFFSNESGGPDAVDRYQALYHDVPAEMLIGDGSTHYSMCQRFPDTAERIYAFNSQAKIIYLVRHPIRRIESAWPLLLSVRHANRVLGFDRTLLQTNLLVDPSMYWRQLGEYRRYFPDEQILILFFEDFAVGEDAVVDAGWRFLGLEPLSVRGNDAVARNESVGKTQRAWIVDAVRAMPGYERHKHLIPQPIKSFLSTRFRSTIDVNTPWSPRTLAWATDQVREDSAALLGHAGRPTSFWTF